MKNDIDYERFQRYMKQQRGYKAKYKADRERRNKEDLDKALEGKHWRYIDGKYVTDQGELYNHCGRRLYGHVQPNGYVQWYVNGRLKMAGRVVYEAFCGKIPPGYEIDYINAVRDDNRLDNLRLLKHQSNCNTPISLQNYSRGNTTGHCKTVIQTLADGTQKEWASATEAGKHGYNKYSIYQCCQGRINTHKNSKWCYKNK